MNVKNQLYKNKYLIPSTRFKGYDYSKPGYYFITICSYKRVSIFSEIIGIYKNNQIIDASVELSDIGEIIEKEWLKTAEIRKNIKLDQYVIMPNHVHGIIQITHQMNNDFKNYGAVETPWQGVSTQAVSMQNNFLRIKKSWKPNSISSIINQFKTACTKKFRQKYNSQNNVWQSRFHDRIIRNPEELNKIRKYIIDNPMKWSYDKNNPKNIL